MCLIPKASGFISLLKDLNTCGMGIRDTYNREIESENISLCFIIDISTPRAVIFI